MSIDLKANIKSCFEDLNETIFTTWNNVDCISVAETMMNTTPSKYFSDTKGDIIPVLQYSPTDSLIYSQNIITNLINWYSTNYVITSDKTNKKYRSFQDQLLNLCLNKQVPGICDGGLKKFCATQTRDNASADVEIMNFCGCYVSPDPTYVPYTLGNSDCSIGNTPFCQMCTVQSEDCIPQPSCDPYCNRSSTIQKSYAKAGDILGCPRGVCVIDIISVNLENSTLPNGVNFNTSCSGCQGGTGGCYCIIGSINVSDTLSTIGVGTNFNELCGPNSICVTINPDNTKTVQPCPDISPSLGTSFFDNLSLKNLPIPNKIVIIIIAILLGIGIIFFIISYFMK